MAQVLLNSWHHNHLRQDFCHKHEKQPARKEAEDDVRFVIQERYPATHAWLDVFQKAIFRR